MTTELSALMNLYGLAILLIFVCGLYSVMVTKNLIRILIGIELLTKGVSLLIIFAGYATGRMAMAQAMVVTVIVVEVVLVPVTAGLIYCLFQHNNSLDVRWLNQPRD